MKKWSDFIFKFDSETKIVLFHTLNRGIVTLEKNIYTELSETLKSKYKDTFYIEEQKNLEEMGFIVKDSYDEFNEFYNSILRIKENEKHISIVLMTTTACDFSCYYCLENNIDKTFYLSKDVANALLNHLESSFVKNTINSLHVTLYGGEPTLGWELVVDTFYKIKNICDKLNVIFTTSIITNGYAFDGKKTLDLVPYNLKSVQITLDGTKEYHDKRRYTKDFSPTFDVIIKNLHDILEISNTVKIALRMNCDCENVVSIGELIEFIYVNFGYERIYFGFSRMLDDYDNIEGSNPYIDYNHVHALDEEAFIEYLIKSNEILKSFGFSIKEESVAQLYCVGKSTHSFFLHPSGDIYKCINQVGIKEFKFGSIFENNQLNDYFDEDLFKECVKTKCCFLPFCHSGCPIKKGKTSCDRKYYEEYNRKMILSRI